MACKPYQIEGVLSEIKEELKGKALISIAAGWNYDKYEKYLDKSTRLQFIMKEKKLKSYLKHWEL